MSTLRPFTTLDPIAIEKKYPKSFKLIKDWLTGSSPEGNVLSKEMMQAFIYGNPRFLYDFFDDQKYVITLEYNTKGWYYWLMEPDSSENLSQDFSSRKLVEEAAFINTFNIMEDKL
jgi:hypothetical protein